MEPIKNALFKFGPACLVIMGTVTIPASIALVYLLTQDKPVAVVDSAEKPAPDLTEPVVIRQRVKPVEPAPVEQPPKQTALQPVPDALIQALYKQSAEMEQLRKEFSSLKHIVETRQFQTSQKMPPVDRAGNTDEALNDIYSDVTPHELPDPMLKALARNPGSRIVADPDTGEYIPAVTEWRQTNWGGGKQLHLLRHKGKVYGQTVLHKGAEPKQETPPPQPPPFRISN